MAGVESPDGRRWEVRRRWLGDGSRRFIDGYRRSWLRVLAELTRSPQLATKVAEPTPPAPLAGTAPAAARNPMGILGLALALVALIAGALFAIFELLVRLVLFVAGLVARIVLRRPWTLEATAEGAERVRHHAVGWSRSMRVRRALMEDLARGETLSAAE